MRTHKLFLKNDGFTVVELLVATAVFVIVITTVIQLLFMFLRGPLRQIRQKQLEEQLVYASSEISRYIRENTIDYSNSTSSSLQLVNTNSTTRNFSFNTADETITFTEITQVTPGVPAETVAANLTGANVEIESLQFFIYPSTDPTITAPGVPAVNNQPAVVTIITARRTDDTSITAQFQVLTTARYYVR